MKFTDLLVEYLAEWDRQNGNYYERPLMRDLRMSGMKRMIEMADILNSMVSRNEDKSISDVVKYFYATQVEMIPMSVETYANIKCAFDGETGLLKSVEKVN